MRLSRCTAQNNELVELLLIGCYNKILKNINGIAHARAAKLQIYYLNGDKSSCLRVRNKLLLASNNSE